MSLLLIAGVALAKPQPNIVLVLIDDLGWKDFGVQGSNVYRTPHIDRLASEGIRFTQSYASGSVCSPTRSAIMSGQNPARLGITDWLPGANIGNQKLIPAPLPSHLPPEIRTLPESLREAGYATWHVGKWHLGSEPHGPTANGFDVNIAGSEAGQPESFFFPYGMNGTSYYRVRPLSGGTPGEYLTDRLTDEAIGLLRKKDSRPFFLMLSHYTVHTPLEAKPEDFAIYENLIGGDFSKRRATYAGMVDNLDQNMGRLMAALKAQNLDRDTLVLLTSDNGGLHDVTDNKPLRMGKGYLYEGGIRVPLIARWPGMIPRGKTVDLPVTSTDYFPTLAEIAGAKLPPRPVRDGKSFAEALFEPVRVSKVPRSLIWHYPHYHTAQRPPCSAIRDGDLKLIHWYEDGRTELYDLANDPKEETDLADRRPKDRVRLKKKLDTWLKSVSAKFAQPNPSYRLNANKVEPEALVGECSCKVS